MAIHEGLSFKCDHCDKVFATKYYLSAHMKNHDVKKLHVCEHCGKQFRRIYELNRHLLIHDNKTFSYNNCNKCFSRKYTVINTKKHAV